MKFASHDRSGAMSQFLKLSIFVAASFAALVLLLFNVWSLQRRVQWLEEIQQKNNGGFPSGGGGNAAALSDGGGGFSTRREVFQEGQVIFYNRVPKCGSTTLMGVVYALARTNRFHCLHVNVTKNDHYMSPSDQYDFAWNVTTWGKRLPGFYHGHIVYIDFARFGAPPPLFIQLVRDPIERMVSYYYFLRYGDDYRPNLTRSRMGDSMSFDDCVLKGHRDCQPRNWWIQIPFFCGMSPQCRVPGSQWALEQAKRNLVDKYVVVGVTEQIPEFVAVLEATLPRFFKGALNLFRTGGKSHLRKTNKKVPPKPETIKVIKATREWQMENELYQLAVVVFNDLKRRTLKASKTDVGEMHYVPRGRQFFFEKVIGPRPL
eukprot:scpid75685/ scgid31021/ Heparan sulfate 2-O-sulfotransferase 1